MSYARTAALPNAAESRIAVFTPVVLGDRRWGSLGVLRRSAQPFGPVVLAYFQSMAAVYAASLTNTVR
ncbi:hypothetical protein AB0F77_22360 [Streptomyces sp. NPDC026672]|uniref:hypothetical protein n=1 Tax=unclassified Streptomyces TaxID=2593676 RepID=UPI0033FAA3D8